jgi:FPC/CPF motif-containing protein YcgG
LPYDERVRPHPDDPHFSLSFGGEAFFIVGLHPNASRKARRFEAPALVFNLHDQFEQLRADGRYHKLRDRIVERDLRFSGSVNPMLATHGEASEARQYSGRAVDDAWVCPFHPRSAASRAA